MPPAKEKSPRRDTLSVIIPAYNEAATIAAVLRQVHELGPIVHEIIVVDDGSTDETKTIVEQLQPELNSLILISLDKNQGKTAAISRGLKESTGAFVIIQDADLEYDPKEIPLVVEPLLMGYADVVYGSRFLVRRASRVLYFSHYLANKAITFLSNCLTNRNMTDVETCYKAFRHGVISPLSLTSSGFGMEIEITAMVCRTSARTYEVPISYYGRTYEEGKKIGFWDGIHAVYYIFYYNLVQTRLSSGREYVATVNDFLRCVREEQDCQLKTKA